MFWRFKTDFSLPNEVKDWIKTLGPERWGTHEGGALYCELKSEDENVFSFVDARRRALAAVGVESAFTADGVKNFLVFVAPGTCLAPHTDMVYKGYAHRRLLYVVCPTEAGGLYVDTSGDMRFEPDSLYEIEADIEHEITTVTGAAPLILLVMSYLK